MIQANQKVNASWSQSRIKEDEINKYLGDDDQDFIPETKIQQQIIDAGRKKTDPVYIRSLLAKSLSIQNLTPEETADLMYVDDPDLIEEMKAAAFQIKKKVYDNRIVTFAPLYMGNYCVNNCSYCGFKTDNHTAERKVLSDAEIREEVKVLAGEIGHRRLIIVYGEHPKNDVDYILSSMKTIYDVNVELEAGKVGNIRRVNVNAPPLCVNDLKKIHDVGIGTYQVFQETYHRTTYQQVHPKNTIKGDYRWRLYCMHRALEAGIDDVGIGALFGLYDWRFEVMGLVYHAWELENRFGIGPHTISFPRLEPALGVDLRNYQSYGVSDEEFLKIILIIRLAIPFTGLILTARETPEIRRAAFDLGITQTDASTKIGVGAYHDGDDQQHAEQQQFILGDTRGLDEVIREFAEMGSITSFCTAGYRCGRTGKCIMDLLRSGTEGQFCKLNAILTFREWLDDFATPETRSVAEPVLEKELLEVRDRLPKIWPKFNDYYERVCEGERDLYM